MSALAALTGCEYLNARATDLGDLVRVEFTGGPGLQVNAGVGEVVHVGLGSSMGSRAGWQYGHLFHGEVLEHYLPVSLIETARVPGYDGLHMISWDYAQPPQHQCYMLLPYGTGHSTARRSDLHIVDLEVGAHLVVFGVQLGVSPGELLDLVLGIWGFDLAGDDSDYTRGDKRLYYLPETPTVTPTLPMVRPAPRGSTTP